MLVKLFITLLGVLLYSNLSAQKDSDVKFDKISDKDFQMVVYEQDTSAVAVILHDEGSTGILYDVKNGFFMNHERFVRIKILKQSGIEWANFQIPLYSEGLNKEEIKSIKGFTYNLENGKISKSELKRESIFRERENKYWEEVKLSMPAVKVGSVIDLKYTITSSLFWNLKSWKIQYTIPVVWSQYEVSYPEYFNYGRSAIGYHPLYLNTSSERTETITSSSVTRGSGWSPQSQISHDKFSYLVNVFKYAAKNVPAMREEQYLTSLDNYATQIKFELASVNFTRVGGQYKSFSNNLNDIVKLILEDQDFGNYFKRSGAVREYAEKFTKNIDDPSGKLNAIYNNLIGIFRWNNHKGFIPSKSVNKLVDDKIGNSADINLFLLALLSESGIEAYPVILSTRDNGILSPAKTLLTDFNYIIVKAIINGNEYLLDATEANLPPGILPMRCLNGNGILIKKDNPVEVFLTNVKSDTKVLASLNFEDGYLKGSVQSRHTGLDAYNFRELIRQTGGEEEYFQKLNSHSKDIKYLDYSYSNIANINEPVSKDYTIEILVDPESDAEVFYFSPIFDERIEKNPFTSPSRVYPVDFGNQFSKSFQVTIDLPGDYTIQEIPESQTFTTTDRSAVFHYQASLLGNKIFITCRLSIEKQIYLPNEYENLRHFFDLIVSKQAEPIVIKKKT